MNTKKVAIAALTLALVVTVFVIGNILFNKRPELTPLRIQFAYPAFSLSPAVYDDWSAAFLGNHIYARLFPDSDRPWMIAGSNSPTVECVEKESKSNSCLKTRVTFQLKELKDCIGRTIPPKQMQAEFFEILKAHPWLFPKWSHCSSTDDAVCFTFGGSSDIYRRLAGLYFRFGWSHQSINDELIGVGPYCLKSPKTNSKGEILEGELLPKKGTSLRPGIFWTSQERDKNFNVALQGSADLLKDKRVNVHTHTPVPYFVVTNPKLAGERLPWNSVDTKNLIKNHLIENHEIYEASEELLRLVPAGSALKTKNHAIHGKRSLPVFLVPDYLPDCHLLAAVLNKNWRNTAHAKCGNLLDFVMNTVKKEPLTGAIQWSGFLISLTPATGSRSILEDQYFSSYSADSFVGGTDKPENFFYLVGLGRSQITVDGETVCKASPFSIGLAELTIPDLKNCGTGN